MSIRDVQADFTYTSTASSFSIAGAAGTYLLPNSYDTSPLGGYLTELTAADTQLTANVNTFRDFGGGERLWLVVDWVVGPNTLTSCRTELITSATSDLGTPTVMIDFGVVAIASLASGTRQIAGLPRSTAWLKYLGVQIITAGSTGTLGSVVAWLAKDIDAAQLGYASGYSIK